MQAELVEQALGGQAEPEGAARNQIRFPFAWHDLELRLAGNLVLRILQAFAEKC